MGDFEIKCEKGYMSDYEMRKFLDKYLPVGKTVNVKTRERNIERRFGVGIYHQVIKAYHQAKEEKLNNEK